MLLIVPQPSVWPLRGYKSFIHLDDGIKHLHPFASISFVSSIICMNFCFGLYAFTLS